MSRRLPSNPNLDNLKKQARELLRACQSGDADALARIKASHPRLSNASAEEIKEAGLTLRDAQLVIAREYGSRDWKALSDAVLRKRKMHETMLEALRKRGLGAAGPPRPRFVFSNRVKRIVQLARDEALRLGHHDIRPEHILLAILREGEGAAITLLRRLGANLTRLKEETETQAGTAGPTASHPDGPARFRFEAKKVLETAADEAKDMGRFNVDSGHLLLAFLKEPGGTPAQAMAKQAIDYDKVRESVTSNLED